MEKHCILFYFFIVRTPKCFPFLAHQSYLSLLSHFSISLSLFFIVSRLGFPVIPFVPLLPGESVWGNNASKFLVLLCLTRLPGVVNQTIIFHGNSRPGGSMKSLVTLSFAGNQCELRKEYLLYKSTLSMCCK